MKKTEEEWRAEIVVTEEGVRRKTYTAKCPICGHSESGDNPQSTTNARVARGKVMTHLRLKHADAILRVDSPT